MSYPINYPTPQNADVQIFSRGGSTSDWVKPQGCSFVFFTLIGAGGNGADGTSSAGGGGGASGAITNCLVPAFLIPDVLRVSVASGGSGGTASAATRVLYQLKDGSGYALLTALNGSDGAGSTGGGSPSAFTTNYFTTIGFFSASGGTVGANAGGSITQTSMVSGGAGGGSALGAPGGSVTPLTAVGYPVIAGGSGGATPTDGKDGISIFSNLLLACGGAGGGAAQNLPTATGAAGGNGGFGSGGGGGGIGSSAGNARGGKGGDGLVVIVSW